jgi:hypothetical protein
MSMLHSRGDKGSEEEEEVHYKSTKERPFPSLQQQEGPRVARKYFATLSGLVTNFPPLSFAEC